MPFTAPSVAVVSTTPASDVIHFHALCGNESFWDPSKPLNGSHPLWSSCLQNTAATWVACGLLWVMSPFYVFYLISGGRLSQLEERHVTYVRKCRRSPLNILKLVCGLVLVALSISETILFAVKGRWDLQRSFISGGVIRILTMALAVILIAVEFRRAIFTSGVMFIFWFVYTIYSAISVYNYSVDTHSMSAAASADKLGKTMLDLQSAYLAFVCLELILCCIVDKRLLTIGGGGRSIGISFRGGGGGRTGENVNLIPGLQEKNISPQCSASFLSDIFFAWYTPALFRSYFTPPNFETLYELLPAESTRKIIDKFNEIFNRVSPTSTESERFISSVWKSARTGIVIGVCLRLLSFALLFIMMILFRVLIQLIQHSGSREQGLLISAVLFVITIVYGLVMTHWLFLCDRMGMHVRTIVTTTLYQKVLKLSVADGADTGCVINVLSIDAMKLALAIRSFQDIVTLPVYLIAAAVFLCVTLGASSSSSEAPYAALLGMAVLVVLVPITTICVGRKVKQCQASQIAERSHRLKLMNEVINGIKVIKLYAWEKFFEKKVTDVRNAELKSMKSGSITFAIANIVCLLTPYFVSLVMFGSFIHLGAAHGTTNQLEPAATFVCLSLVSLLNFNVFTLPSSINYFIQGLNALRLAASFMESEDVDPDQERNMRRNGTGSIEIVNGTFTWSQGCEPTLKSINLKVDRGKLVAIVGSVGSGKSSLLYSLLGEMVNCSGSVIMQEKVAYASQQAWVQQGTFRDNICFGKQYSKSFFDEVVDACALREDFRKLPGGEMMQLGTKGGNLSGGQKQRVNLARAVYQDADVCLIDDALSAVDPQVAKHIFDNVIGPRGLLKDKTRVFATNSLSFLPAVDHIVVLKDGRVVEQGTYAKLRQSAGEFAQLLKEFVGEGAPPQRPSENAAENNAPKRGSSIPRSWRRTRTVTSGTTSLEYTSNSSVRRRTYQSASSYGALSPVAATHGGEFPERGRNSWKRLSARAGLNDNAAGDSGLGSLEQQMNIVADEAVDVGFVGWRVIGSYIKDGGLVKFTVLVVTLLLIAGSQAMSNIWLCMWSDNRCMPSSWNKTLYKNRSGLMTTADAQLGIYGLLGIIQTLATIVHCLVVALGFATASKTLHQKALYPLFRAPMAFFDTTPIGRILNYFSADMDTADLMLPMDVQLFLPSLIFLLSTVITIAFASVFFLVILIPILVINFIIQRIYGANAIGLRRLYAVKKSLLCSHFEETVCGIGSIRAYRKQQDFIDTCERLMDIAHKPWYQCIVSWRWFTNYNLVMGAVTTILIASTAVVSQQSSAGQSLGPGKIGLALFSVFQVLNYIPVVNRFMTEIEANVVSVARIKRYSAIALEKPWESLAFRPQPTWPSNGALKFNQYSARHRPGLPRCLTSITANVAPAEKVGIVGRTGAGKSSIALSLFRIMEADNGFIEIDGVNISHVGLHDLRSRITIIPQEPVMFSGTLRSNLDPLSRYTDADIWNALDHAHLKPYITETYAGGLNEMVSCEEFSIGQRQLLCMARALLRKSKVIVMDEATAGVDYETDKLIQDTIRTQFTQATILTIAHRLATIIDYDKVMVFDKGQLIEYAAPQSLLNRPTSLFAQMAQDVHGLQEILATLPPRQQHQRPQRVAEERLPRIQDIPDD